MEQDYVAAHVPSPLAKRARARATAEDRSLASLLRRALELYLTREA